MKPLYLKKETELAAFVDSINGRATSHTLTATDLHILARRAERQLTDSGVPKGMWRGIRAHYWPGGPGKAYSRKGRSVKANRVALEYRAGGWALVDLEKLDIWADSKEEFTLHVPAAVLERVKEEACKPYRMV